MVKIITNEDINRIDQVCKQYNIENYTINLDGSIDVDGNVDLYDKNLYELPLRFGKVSGYFHCGDNKLTSLEFSPSSVSGDFVCCDNDLPDHFMYLYNKLILEEIKIFFKYHHDLRIWDNNGYNEEEAQILYEEIIDGML